jgi:hypothetical protein
MYDLEDINSWNLRKVGTYLPNYTESHFRDIFTAVTKTQ